MRRIAVEQLEKGMVLGRSLFSGTNTLALAAGQTLDTRYIQLLAEYGYQWAYIEEDGFEEITPQDILSDTTRRLAENALHKGVDTLQHAVRMKSDSGQITGELLKSEPELFNIPNVDDMSQAVSSVVRDIIDRNIGLIDVFAEVAHSTYIYRHAVNVAALSVLVGRQFGFNSRQLRELGLAALLHDFGKVCLGDKLMHRPKHDLEGDDLFRFQEHPTFGSILIHNTDPDLVHERLTVLQHHEWQNGGGYPQGLKGDNQPPSRGVEREGEGIHRFAEIISVAESYDNLVHGNGEVPRPLDPADALGMIMSFSHKRFNQAVCHAFSQIVCLYPTGSMTRIQQTTAFGLEGYYAIVKEQGESPGRPSLILYADPEGNRVRPKTLDFTEDRSLKLKLMV